MSGPTLAGSPDAISGNPGDVFRIKGTAPESHHHGDLEQRLRLFELQLLELRAEWDEFIAAVEARDAGE